MSSPASVSRFPALVYSLLAALLFSCVVVIPFLPSFGPAASYVFEVELASNTSGEAQLFYDIGRGINESDSVRVLIASNEALRTVRFTLPTGDYRQLRLDPIDRPAHLQLRNPRISTPSGLLIHRFSPEDFSALNDVEIIERDNQTARLAVSATGNDPNLRIALKEPLELVEKRAILSDLLKRALPVFSVLGSAVLLLHLLLLRQGERVRRHVHEMGGWVAAHPHRTLSLVAVVAVIASCYPVVFLGKSFVSPNFRDGTFLLYGEFPTLPGTRDAVTEDAKGSDVGAIMWQQVPYSFIQNRALLHDGELPLWNRYSSCGTVLLGQGQSMFGDPLHLPVILAGGAAWAWDLKYLFARWLLCVGLGLTVLRCTRDLRAAALTAVASAFLGFFIYRLNHPAYFSFCYAPWILYAWVRLADADTWRRLAGSCTLLILASVCELNSGTVKEAYMLLLGLHFAGLVVVLLAAKPWRERIVALAAAGWAGVLFVLLTAPTWMTLLGALKQAYTAYDLPAAYQIHPSVALGFFDELFYRPLVIQERVFNPSANFLVLIGVLYFVAAFSRASAAAHARAIAWGSLLPIAIVFGLVPPQWIVKVPFIGNVVHIDNCFSCVLIILAVVIAGFGWSAAFTRLKSPEGRGDLGRVAALYALLVFPWISLTHTVHRPTFGVGTTFSFLQWGHRLPVSGFVWGSLLALTLAVALLLFTLRRALVRQSLGVAGALLLALAFTTILWRHGQHTRSVGPADYVFTPATRVDFKAVSNGIAALQADQHEPERAFGLSSNLFPGWTCDYNIEGINSADALINPAFRELTTALGFERIWDWRLYLTPPGIAAMKPALDFLNVRHYADLRSDHGLIGSVLTPVKFADLDIYRSETTWPRAFFAGGVTVYDKHNELAEKIRHASGRPFAAVQRRDLANLPAVAALTSSQTASANTSRARDYRLTTNKTSFTVDATGPGVAVLHEAWLPRSFKATLNGEPVPYFRINHAFKGVLIPAAGKYRVEFAYWPPRMTLALILSALGAGLFIVTAIVARRSPTQPFTCPAS